MSRGPFKAKTRVRIPVGDANFLALLGRAIPQRSLLFAARFREARQRHRIPLGVGGPAAFAVYHCSQISLNMNRTEPEQRNDWKRIGVALARMSKVGRGPGVVGR